MWVRAQGGEGVIGNDWSKKNMWITTPLVSDHRTTFSPPFHFSSLGLKINAMKGGNIEFAPPPAAQSKNCEFDATENK